MPVGCSWGRLRALLEQPMALEPLPSSKGAGGAGAGCWGGGGTGRGGAEIAAGQSSEMEPGGVRRWLGLVGLQQFL